MNHDSRPVGVFDSGCGGISTLKEMTKLMPDESFIFYGDQAFAPYGTRPEEYVLGRAQAVTRLLLQEGAKALVIACNTATAAAAKDLRAQYDMPIIGMEPAVKPASLVHRDGLVLCLATPGTLKSEKFHLLVSRFGEVTPLPCPGLMELVESGKAGTAEAEEYLEALLAPYRGLKIDAAVLGCTHYVFMKDEIQRHLPEGVPVFDGNAGTARQARRRLEESGLTAAPGGKGSVRFMTSGTKDDLERMKMLFGRHL